MLCGHKMGNPFYMTLYKLIPHFVYTVISINLLKTGKIFLDCNNFYFRDNGFNYT